MSLAHLAQLDIEEHMANQAVMEIPAFLVKEDVQVA